MRGGRALSARTDDYRGLKIALRILLAVSVIPGCYFAQTAVEEGEERFKWQEFEAGKGTADISAAVWTAMRADADRLRSEGSWRQEVLPWIERKNRNLGQKVHGHEHALRQSIAGTARIAGQQAWTRQERKYLLARLEGLTRAFERTERTIASLDSLVAQADASFGSQLGHARSYYLARGFIEVPKKCRNALEVPDYSGALLDESRSRAVSRVPDVLDEAGRSAALRKKFTSLLGEYEPSASLASEAIVLTFPLGASGQRQSPPPAAPVTAAGGGEAAGEGGELATDGESAGASQSPGTEGAGSEAVDSGAGEMTPPTEVVRETLVEVQEPLVWADGPNDMLFVLALLEIKRSRSADPSGAGIQVTDLAGGCSPGAMRFDVVLDDQPGAARGGWPRSWDHQHRLRPEDVASFERVSGELVGFWESLVTGVNDTEVGNWIEGWFNDREWIFGERRKLEESRRLLATDAGAIHERLRTMTTLDQSSDELRVSRKSSEEKRSELMSAVGETGSYFLHWDVSFESANEGLDAAAAKAILQELRQAADAAAEEFVAELEERIGSIVTVDAGGVTAIPRAFFPVAISWDDLPSGGRKYKLEVALRFDMKLTKSALTPRDLFSYEDRRLLATFLPSMDRLEVIVDEVTWRVPGPQDPRLVWSEAQELARQTPKQDGCGAWRLPAPDELRAIARPEEDDCTLFPELGIECGVPVWTDEQMGRAENYRTIIFGKKVETDSPHGSTNTKALLVCDPDWSGLDDVPPLSPAIADLLRAEQAGGTP